MLKHSFIFLERITKAKEQKIWQQGIASWQDFLRAAAIKGITSSAKFYYDRKIKEAEEAALENDAYYFARVFPRSEHWRLYSFFKEEAGFLDIETDLYGKITVVGISNYYNSNFFVRDVNLNLAAQEIQKYKMIITFNGASFDLPKIKKQLGIQITVPHLDLRLLCTKLNLKGGLKEVEKILNLKRPEHLYLNPIEFWEGYCTYGKREYLDQLIEYNREDIENLKLIADHVCSALQVKVEQTAANEREKQDDWQGRE